MAIFFPFKSPNFSCIEKASNKAWVGCSCVPSPAFTILALILLDRKCGAPGLLCLITTISTFMASILLTVSSKVSPFLTELPAEVKFMVSADNRFSANSNDNLVRVEFSKKRLAMVMSLSEGTFLMGLLITSLNSLAVSSIKLISFSVIFFIPSKCRVLKESIYV